MRFKGVTKNGKLMLNAERELVRACLDYLTLKGYVPIRNNAGLLVINSDNRRRVVRMAQKGAPDIIACSPEGRFVAIECKTESGRLMPHQKTYLEMLKKKGALVLVVRSVDQLIKALEREKDEKAGSSR